MCWFLCWGYCIPSPSSPLKSTHGSSSPSIHHSGDCNIRRRPASAVSPMALRSGQRRRRPSSVLPSSPHTAAAAESTDRSPRPTSAPAIAQSQVTEGPGAPAKKAPKEAVKVEEKRGEEPAEPEPEPTEAWKVRLTCRGPLARALGYRGFQSSGVSQLPNNVAFSHCF